PDPCTGRDIFGIKSRAHRNKAQPFGGIGARPCPQPDARVDRRTCPREPSSPAPSEKGEWLRVDAKNGSIWRNARSSTRVDKLVIGLARWPCAAAAGVSRGDGSILASARAPRIPHVIARPLPAS